MRFSRHYRLYLTIYAHPCKRTHACRVHRDARAYQSSVAELWFLHACAAERERERMKLRGRTGKRRIEKNEKERSRSSRERASEGMRRGAGPLIRRSAATAVGVYHVPHNICHVIRVLHTRYIPFRRRRDGDETEMRISREGNSGGKKKKRKREKEIRRAVNQAATRHSPSLSGAPPRSLWRLRTYLPTIPRARALMHE